MFKQTTDLTFDKYGTVLPNLPLDITDSKDEFHLNIEDTSISKLFISSEDVYIRLKKGVVLILVSDNNSVNNINSYIINSRVLLKKGTYFNFIPISKECSITLYIDKILMSELELESPYTYEEIIPTLSIDKIYTKFYQEKPINYLFKGEKHYFWELTFIDRGTLYTTVDGKEFELKQGDIFFYAPNQYHSQYTDNQKPCSYLTISFDMTFTDAFVLSNTVFHADKKIYIIMQNLMNELNSSSLYRNELTLCYLKQLILSILNTNFEDSISKPLNNTQEIYNNNLLDNILDFIHNNLCKNLVVQDICDNFSISTSKLHTLFKSHLNTTTKSYINDLKLKKGKDLIKEYKYNISEISEMLGFNSIHYFSTSFKKKYGFSPSEYLKSINKNH